MIGIEIHLPAIVDGIGAQRMFKLDAIGVVVQAGSALQDGRDDGGPLGHAGHGIHFVERFGFLAAKFFADVAADEGNLAGAAHEQDAVDVLGAQTAQ